MKFNKFIPLLFTLVILGCTSGSSGGSGFSQTAGAAINDFSFDISKIEDYGDQAVLTISYQNVGGKTMNGDTFTYVYGAPITKTTPKNNPPSAADDRKWGVLQPTGTEVDVAKQRITWTDTSTAFYPPDQETGQPGMSNSHRVVLEPPKLDEGMNNIPYTFEARLCYPYRTTTSSTIRSIAQNTFASVVAKKGLAETKESAGPIQISLKAGETIRANTGGGSTSLPLVFEVKDVGGGFATKDTETCNPVIEKSKIGVIDVSVSIDGESATCSGSVYIRNGVGNLFCTGNFANQNPKTQYQIVANTKYKYYVSKSATITLSDSRDTGDTDAA